jgi:hypothetical protein
VIALTTAQIRALESQDVAALQTSQIAALTTKQITQGLSTQQISALTTVQVESLTSTQISSFTTVQIQALTLGTPLVLDLNGNGIETQSIHGGTMFDLLGTGEKINTGWVTGGDGLLVLDRNSDGQINDGGELFGEATLLADGRKAQTGYEALADLDSNADGLINQNDAAFGQLQVWVDADADGLSQAGELNTLESLGITQLDLNASAVAVQNNGNIIGLSSSYQTADGQNHALADVWFLADKVSGMVQAMSSYAEAAMASSVLPADPLAAMTQGTATSSAIGQLVGVLSQYDPNGQMLAGNAAITPPTLMPQTVEANNLAINALLVNGK